MGKQRAKPNYLLCICGLRSPDLDNSKTAVLRASLRRVRAASPSTPSQGFIGWYCSEPRLAFNRILCCSLSLLYLPCRARSRCQDNLISSLCRAATRL